MAQWTAVSHASVPETAAHWDFKRIRSRKMPAWRHHGRQKKVDEVNLARMAPAAGVTEIAVPRSPPQSEDDGPEKFAERVVND